MISGLGHHLFSAEPNLEAKGTSYPRKIKTFGQKLRDLSAGVSDDGSK
jgi:hypothetical protein